MIEANMTRIRSMKDLVKAKEKAAEKERDRAKKHPFLIRIGMSSCGIAAGANDTYAALQKLISGNELPGVNSEEIAISPIGCIGLCAVEPIIQVKSPGLDWVTYGKVSPDVARRILKDHIGNGMVVNQYQVESI